MELKVRGRTDPAVGKHATHPGKLAGAISAEVRSGECPVVTAIGPAACAIGMQGLELAQAFLRADGVLLSWQEERAVVQIDGGDGKALQTRYIVAVTQEATSGAEGDGEIGAGADRGDCPFDDERG